MKSWVTDSEGMVGVREKQAEKISKEWYNPKRRETSALWGATARYIHKGGEIPMSELRAQVAEAVKDRTLNLRGRDPPQGCVPRLGLRPGSSRNERTI